VESSTVQSHYALQTADMVAERVVARSTSPLCRKDESGQHYHLGRSLDVCKHIFQ